MNDIIEISELDMNDNFDSWSTPKSSNFGSGIELLMNDKMKDSHKPTSDIDLEDLDKAYDDDLDQDGKDKEDQQQGSDMGMPPGPAGLGAPSPAGAAPAMGGGQTI